MQLEFFDVPSPCIGVCQTDDKGYCLGCMRTREERQTWLNLSCADRQKVIKRCRQRKKRRENANKPKMATEEVVIVQHSLLDSGVDAKPGAVDAGTQLSHGNIAANSPGQESKENLSSEVKPANKAQKKQGAQEKPVVIEDDIDFSDFEL